MTVEDVRLGRILKALRIGKRLRQLDLAHLARVSQSAVSRAERGLLGTLPIDEVRRIFAALGARVELRAMWEGAGVDRLIDERHAALVELTARRLKARGWAIVAEVSFSHFGERGSIDLLAFHPGTRSLLVVEVKTELGAIEATLRTLDVKVRLAARIARERFGWFAATTSRIIVFPDDRTVRRHVDAHATSIGSVFALKGAAVRAWVQDPSAAIGGLWFMTAAASSRPRPRRVRPKPVAQSGETGSPGPDGSRRPGGGSPSVAQART
jgi:transcriptional regulator with XRE-family HTH domain